MKTAQLFNTKEEHEISELSKAFYAKNLFEEKTRINLYLPKIVVKIIDKLAKNNSRGKLVTSLVMEKLKKFKKTPYGMFSPLEVKEEELDVITSSLDSTISELV